MEKEPIRKVNRELEKWPITETSRDLRTAVIASIRAGKMLKDAFNSDYDVHIKADRSEFTPYDELAENIASKIIREYEPQAKILGEEISPNEDTSSGDFWVIDGIDGTTNFSRGIPICNFTLAKVESGKTQVGVVFDFLNDNLYYAKLNEGAYKNGKKLSVSTREFTESVISFAPLRDANRGKSDYEAELVRATRSAMGEITDKSGRFHREIQSGALELAWLAEGRLDGYVSSWTSPWDLSAGVLLVRESGGKATNILGEKWEPSYWGVIAGNAQVHSEIFSILHSNFMKELHSSDKIYPV